MSEIRIDAGKGECYRSVNQIVLPLDVLHDAKHNRVETARVRSVVEIWPSMPVGRGAVTASALDCYPGYAVVAGRGIDAPDDQAFEINGGQLFTRRRDAVHWSMSLVGDFIERTKFQGERADDARAVDMGERIRLLGGGAPANAFRRLDLLDLDLNVARTFGMLIHSLTENTSERCFRNRLLRHRYAPPEQQLTSILPSASGSSPVGKQIVNLAQLFLGVFGGVSDFVRLAAITGDGDRAPVRLETSVCNPGDADSGHVMTTRHTADFLQDDQLEVLRRDQLLCHASAPVRVATGALLAPDCLYASRNQHSAKKNVSIVPLQLALQVVLFSQLDAATNDSASKIRIVVVAAGDGAPAIIHRDYNDRLGSRTFWGDSKHQGQPISQVFGWLTRKGGWLDHIVLTDQPMLLGNLATDLGDASGDLLCDLIGPVVSKPGSGAPAITVAEDLNDEPIGDVAFPAQFMLDDEFELSWSVQAGHGAILAVSDRSTAMWRTGSDVLFVLISDGYPALDRVVGLLPMGGKCRNTALVDAVGKLSEFLQCSALRGLNARRGVGRRGLGAQAKDQPSRLFNFAVQCGLENSAAVSRFKETNFVRHPGCLSVQSDSVCPVDDPEKRHSHRGAMLQRFSHLNTTEVAA